MHSEQFGEHSPSNTFDVYCGQGLSQTEGISYRLIAFCSLGKIVKLRSVLHVKRWKIPVQCVSFEIEGKGKRFFMAMRNDALYQ